MIDFDSWHGVWLLGPAMSQPREIVPGATYLITRRTLRRHLLFRPDAAITQLLVYALAVSTSRFGLQVHALCAMSTHLHLVVTDVQGVLPRFLQALRDRNPTFAVGREQGGAWRAAAAAVSAFRRTYRAALERWRAGARDAVFPAGTWWMKAFHGASVSEVVMLAG